MTFEDESVRAEWNICAHIMIAYHMARIYRENEAKAVKFACMAASLKTKSRIIYEFCMRIIRSDDDASIINAVKVLQQDWEKDCVI